MVEVLFSSPLFTLEQTQPLHISEPVINQNNYCLLHHIFTTCKIRTIKIFVMVVTQG